MGLGSISEVPGSKLLEEERMAEGLKLVLGLGGDGGGGG